jgi:hypothetical protein
MQGAYQTEASLPRRDGGQSQRGIVVTVQQLLVDRKAALISMSQVKLGAYLDARGTRTDILDIPRISDGSKL